MNKPLFAGRYVFHEEGPEGIASLLERYAEKSDPADACEVAKLLVEAARKGDSACFRKLGDWVDLAKQVKRKGLKPEGEAVDATIRDLLSAYDDRDPPVTITARDMKGMLDSVGLDLSESSVKARLRHLRGESKPGRPRKSAGSS